MHTSGRSLLRSALLIALALGSEVAMAGTRPQDPAPARICRWSGGKQAALSLRFDDSHPTHITQAVPMLDEFGLVGTFLVNPGNRGYQQYQSVWEGLVLQHGHELGDHTWNHNDAATDEEAEVQIGKAAELLHRLQPQLKLIVFGRGGATRWYQRKPIAFFEAKYQLRSVDDAASGWVLSCAEAYPSFNFQQFVDNMDQAIAKGVWFRPYFHEIQEERGLYITPETFRAILRTVHDHRADFWQAGMSAIHQYERERLEARLWVYATDANTLALSLTCATEAELYTQPLTLEVDLPAGARAATVTDAAGKAVPVRVEEAEGRRVVRFEVAPVDAVFTVQAPRIGAACEVGRVTAPGPHPYLFFTAAEAPAVLAKTSDSLAKSHWEMILREADSFVAKSAPEDLKGQGLWDLSYRIEVLGLAYRLSGKEAYGRAAVPCALALAADESWYGGPKTEFLLTAAAMQALGISYDWLYDLLTPEQRTRLRDAAVQHGLEPLAQFTKDGEWWSAWYRCNWGAVIYSGGAVAALALLDDDLRAADWARLCEEKLWHYTQSVGDDGGWGESVGYGSYAWSNAVVGLDALRRVTGTDLFDNDHLRRLSSWFLHLLDPSQQNYVTFSNSDLGTDGAMDVLARLAREYHDGYAQSAAQEMLTRRDWPAVFTFLWYDPTVPAQPLADLPRTKVLPDLSWATARSSWDDPSAVLLGFKGGQKDWDHQHHDTNSFVLYAYGRPLLIDLLYPHKIWGCLTEAHNTIMVNEKDQAGHVNVQGGRDDPQHRGVIGDALDTPWYVRFVGDASLAYEPGEVRSFVREVMYLRKAAPSDPPNYFLMFDDVNATAPARMDWMLHTYGDLRISGNTITITQDDAVVDVTVVAPESFLTETGEKSLDESGLPKPFDSAQVVRTLKLRPSHPVSRGYFLSVLAPRPAASPSPIAIAPIRLPNLMGAKVSSTAAQDLALFALDEPAISAEGVEAVGHSCFIRRVGGRVAAATLHDGQRMSVDGMLLFETSYSGSAALTFAETAVTAELDLYDSGLVRIHTGAPPLKVLVNGREHRFTYEPDRQCVRLDGWIGSRVTVTAPLR